MIIVWLHERQTKSSVSKNRKPGWGYDVWIIIIVIIIILL